MIWFLVAINVAILILSGRQLRRLRKMYARSKVIMDEAERYRSEVLDEADKFRAEARYLRDRWKLANLLEDAKHGPEL